MKKTALEKGFGSIVTSVNQENIVDVSPHFLFEQVRDNGIVVFRGFASSPDAFESFTRKIATRFIHNGNDSRADLGDEGRTRSVTPGNAFIGPHSEFAYTPFRPDLLFFYTDRPAASGGESLFWDGAALWRDMPAAIKDIFTSKRLLYRFPSLPVAFFSQFIGRSGLSEVCAFLDGVPHLRYRLAGEAIDVEFSLAAFGPGVLDGKLAFANSVTIDPRTLLDDGTVLPPLIRAQILEVALKQTLAVKSQKGDVIVIDNSRLMHGRSAFQDEQRSMYVRMGYLDPALLS